MTHAPADGITYDRGSIEGWFKLGNITSPLTGLELDTKMTIPNISQLATLTNEPVYNTFYLQQRTNLPLVTPLLYYLKYQEYPSPKHVTPAPAFRSSIRAWREKEGAALIKRTKGAASEA